MFEGWAFFDYFSISQISAFVPWEQFHANTFIFFEEFLLDRA